MSEEYRISSAISEINNKFIDELIGTQTDNNVLSGGGLFSSSNDNKANEAVVIAAHQKKYNIVAFLMANNLVTDYSTKSKHTGRTLLQYIIIDYPLIPQADYIINIILQNKSISSHINSQDKEGNTALHLAAMTNNDSLCELLVSAGANQNIRNKNGRYVGTETEAPCDDDDDDNAKITPVEINDYSTTNIINEKPAAQNDASKEEQEFVDSVVSAYLNEPQKINVINRANQESQSDSSLGMSNSASTNLRNKTEDINTDEFVSQMLEQLKKNSIQSGGGKKREQKRVTGTRKLLSLSEHGGDQSNDYELARAKENKATKIHEEVVETIKKLLTDKKIKGYTKTDDDEIEIDARVIKALLYKKAKDANKDATGEERAIAMRELATKNKKEITAAISLLEESKEIREAVKENIDKNNSESSKSNSESNDSKTNDSETDVKISEHNKSEESLSMSFSLEESAISDTSYFN